MIAKLYGRIDETGLDHLVIDVNGVGYLVQASARTLAALGKTDDFHRNAGQRKRHAPNRFRHQRGA